MSAEKIADGVPVQCNFTRAELTGFLEKSGYGANEVMFNTMLAHSPSGPICRCCNRPVGAHDAAAPPAAAAMASPAIVTTATAVRSGLEATTQNIRATPAQLVEKHPEGALYPPHWRGFAWFAPFVETLGFNGDTTFVRHGGKRHPGFYNRHVAWRCVVPDERSGEPCGVLFVTDGVFGLERSSPDGALASFHPSKQIIDHMQTAHGILAPPRQAREFKSNLWGCCAHTKSTLDCLLCYANLPCGPMQRICLTAAPPGNGECVEAAHLVRHQQPRKGCDVSCGKCMSCILMLFIPHMILIGTLATVAGILTMCGLPCSEGFPPLPCCICYRSRRHLVYELNVDEGQRCSKLTTIFCCPCSECQLWRELYYSGIWPGLTCCDADQEDLAVMDPTAVRQRYGVAGAGNWRSSLPAAAADLTTLPAVGVAGPMT